jgi:hypothetical protein
MSSAAKAQRLLLERLGSAATTMLMSLHLELPTPPAWGDGVDADGRSVVLVGAHALRALPEGDAAVGEVLAQIKAGQVPMGVKALAFAPRASQAFATGVAGAGVKELLLHGPRNTGKTVVVAAMLAALAEYQQRAGIDGALKVLWLHTTMALAQMKTATSLEGAPFYGAWQVRQAREVAAFVLGGAEMVTAHFVPTEDPSALERLKTEADEIVVEEPVASLSESGGVTERAYELALSSLGRRPTARPIALLSTNPGSRTHWCFARFFEPGRAGCVEEEIPAADRLSSADQEAQIDRFRNSPDLRDRLALGLWTSLQEGPAVTPNFNPSTHVSKTPLVVDPFADVFCGWDSGGQTSCHACVVGQRVGSEVRVFCGLVLEDSDLSHFLDSIVTPWFARHMPQLLRRGAGGSERFVHICDPSMFPQKGGVDNTISGKGRVQRSLGGIFREGPRDWAGRIDPLLALLNAGNNRGGMSCQLDPGPHCELLRRALSGEAHYPVSRSGLVDRSLQQKNNRPWEDLIDGAAYLASGVVALLERARRDERRGPQQTSAKSSLSDNFVNNIQTQARRSV